MAVQQHPSSLDISKEENYSITIFCRPQCWHLENKSMAYTRLPHQVTFKLDVQILLVSSSNAIHYQRTDEKISLPSQEVFSWDIDECRKSMKKLIIDLRAGPLVCLNNGSKLEWTAEESNGPSGSVSHRKKLLDDSEGVVSELVEYVKNMRDSPPLAVEKLCFNITIKKLVTQPEGVIQTWRSWCSTSWSEYHDFVYCKPVKYVCGLRRALKALEKMRQRRVDFDEDGMCCICLDKLSESGRDGGSEVTRLPCRHVYHESCLVHWLNLTFSCPYCRAQVHMPPPIDHH